MNNAISLNNGEAIALYHLESILHALSDNVSANRYINLREKARMHLRFLSGVTNDCSPVYSFVDNVLDACDNFMIRRPHDHLISAPQHYNLSRVVNCLMRLAHTRDADKLEETFDQARGYLTNLPTGSTDQDFTLQFLSESLSAVDELLDCL